MFRHDYSVAQARIRNAVRGTGQARMTARHAASAPAPGTAPARGEDMDAALRGIRAGLLTARSRRARALDMAE